MQRLKLSWVSNANLGLILADLSRAKPELKSQLQLQALGYAQALLDSRPSSPEFNSPEETSYIKLSQQAAKIVIGIADPDQSIFQLRDANKSSVFSTEFDRMRNTSRSPAFTRILDDHHREALKQQSAVKQAREAAEKIALAQAQQTVASKHGH